MKRLVLAGLAALALALPASAQFLQADDILVGEQHLPSDEADVSQLDGKSFVALAFRLFEEDQEAIEMGKLKSTRSGLVSTRTQFGVANHVNIKRDHLRDATQPWRAWYKTARWQKLRMQVLRRDATNISDRPHLMPNHILFKDDPWLWPVCQMTCALLVHSHPGPLSPVADHRVPHRGDPNLFWDLDNLQAVSKSYHDSTKQKLDRRGTV